MYFRSFCETSLNDVWVWTGASAVFSHHLLRILMYLKMLIQQKFLIDIKGRWGLCHLGVVYINFQKGNRGSRSAGTDWPQVHAVLCWSLFTCQSRSFSFDIQQKRINEAVSAICCRAERLHMHFLDMCIMSRGAFQRDTSSLGQLRV